MYILHTYIVSILAVLIDIIYKRWVWTYRPFHKTLPRFSAFLNWLSVIFYETDCIQHILWLTKYEGLIFFNRVNHILREIKYPGNMAIPRNIAMFPKQIVWSKQNIISSWGSNVFLKCFFLNKAFSFFCCLIFVTVYSCISEEKNLQKKTYVFLAAKGSPTSAKKYFLDCSPLKACV